MAESEMMDRGKLTQRELLILLTDQIERMTKSLDKLSIDYIDIVVRITKIETRQQTSAAWWGFVWGMASVLITIIFNFLIQNK